MAYTFLIGATGLLGRYLLRDLLAAGERVAVLVRPTDKQTGRERVESALQRAEAEIGSPLPRPVCFEGDVTQPDFGLTPAAIEWIAEHCHSMIHSAAVLTFSAEGNGEPWHTNVGGTKNALAICRATGLRHLHYVSTAYVCGLRKGTIREDDLDQGQEFRNDYELSKFQAETLVRQADFLETHTIYRPAVISGDSQTGFTNTYHGLYLYLKLMSVLAWNTEPGPDGVRYTPVRLEMSGDEPRNIVPVDWVSQVILNLYQNRSAHGQTFHLAPEQPITPREVIEAGYNYFNSRGVEFCEPSQDAAGPISDIDRNAHENMTIYKLYEASDPRFDTANLSKFAPQLPCPRIDEAMLHRYWRYGEADRWGKRRQKNLPVENRIGRFLRGAVRSSSAAAALDRTLGLDIVGPEGGQWTIGPDASGRPALRDGIAHDCGSLFRIPSDKFLEWVEMDAQRQTETVPRLARYLRLGDPEESLADLLECLTPHSAKRGINKSRSAVV